MSYWRQAGLKYVLINADLLCTCIHSPHTSPPASFKTTLERLKETWSGSAVTDTAMGGPW